MCANSRRNRWEECNFDIEQAHPIRAYIKSWLSLELTICFRTNSRAVQPAVQKGQVYWSPSFVIVRNFRKTDNIVSSHTSSHVHRARCAGRDAFSNLGNGVLKTQADPPRVNSQSTPTIFRKHTCSPNQSAVVQTPARENRQSEAKTEKTCIELRRTCTRIAPRPAQRPTATTVQIISLHSPLRLPFFVHFAHIHLAFATSTADNSRPTHLTVYLPSPPLPALPFWPLLALHKY